MRQPDQPSRERAGRWDGTYEARGAQGVSWYQAEPGLSLELIEALGVPASAAVIDVGGGASSLAEYLVQRGFRDVSVLDVSAVALDEARGRLPDAHVRWIEEDVLAWTPERRFDLWHDRALFHFFVAADDRERYLDTLRAAVRPLGLIMLATFAPDAPERCSGLPVARYSAADLCRVLGAGFEVSETRREEHVTPGGAVQPFTWVAGRLRVQ